MEQLKEARLTPCTGFVNRLVTRVGFEPTLVMAYETISAPLLTVSHFKLVAGAGFEPATFRL